jgi:hypothetical protein
VTCICGHPRLSHARPALALAGFEEPECTIAPCNVWGCKCARFVPDPEAIE